VIQHQDDDNRAASSAAAASGEGPSSSEGDVGALLPRGVRVLALDCEMAKTDTQGGRTLVGLSVVDASGKVVLDSLVKPREPVVDYVTHITGISEKDLRVRAF
jgi:DNA polymerase III epsilon subunit-like protein